MTQSFFRYSPFGLIGKLSLVSLSLAGGTSSAVAEDSRPVYPGEIWFNHDGTNIMTTLRTGESKQPFSEDLFRRSIDELAGLGIDAVSFSPGNGSVPWWQSEYNPHWDWFVERTGKKPSAVGRYVMAGGDLVQAFVEECRSHDLSPIISVRLKDEHHINRMDSEHVSKFYYEHQHWRLDPSPRAVFGVRGLNWIHPEVRQERIDVITELAENYDIDGIELDFMRFPPFFDYETTPVEERQDILTGFIADVREILDRTAKADQTRWLAIRVPNRLDECLMTGIDPARLDREGLVDIITLSPSYVSQVEHDVEEVADAVDHARVFFELTHASSRGPSPSWGEKGDDYPIRVITDEQLTTAANLAYARGASGLNFFNFHYTRPSARSGTLSIGGSIGREPSFDLIAKMRDTEWLQEQPQNYWIPYWWRTGDHGRRYQLPMTVRVGESAEVELDLALPTVPAVGGKLRLRFVGGTPILSATEPIDFSKGVATLQWSASINGHDLAPTEDVSEPFPEQDGGFLGEPRQYAAWEVPTEVLQDGDNTLLFTLVDGPISPEFSIQLIWIDLAVYTEAN